MKKNLAVCTMFQDEPEFLPIWIKYYGNQAGLNNCFVIDHGSQFFDKSVFSAKNIFHLAKTPQDEMQRVNAISNLTEYLLNYYDTVMYTDIDEIVVANPAKWSGLQEYCLQNSAKAVYTVGLNVQHLPDTERPFSINEGVLRQRPWVRFVSPMCKPLILRSRVVWSKGFHSCDLPAVVDEIYLFHLRNFDVDVSLKRLARTRLIERRTEADELGAAHQRVDDQQVLQWIRSVAGLPKVEVESLNIDLDPVASLLRETFGTESGKPKLDITGKQLWKTPTIFHDQF